MRRVTLLLLSIVVLVNSSAPAQNVLSGHDVWVSNVKLTYQDFTGPFVIPVGFFGPNSDPFTDRVFFNAFPLDQVCGGPPQGNVNVIIQRQADAILPGVPSGDVIPIELVSLSLVSVNPIIVTYNGGQSAEPWKLEWFTPQVAPAVQGHMQIQKTAPQGGTFHSSFQVAPRFIFTRLSDNAVRELDFGIFGLYDDFLQLNPNDWRHDPGTLACPGCQGPNFYPGWDSTLIQSVVFVAPNAQLGVTLGCELGPIATDSRSWGFIKTLYRD
jgi:hypothetical protein